MTTVRKTMSVLTTAALVASLCAAAPAAAAGADAGQTLAVTASVVTESAATVSAASTTTGATCSTAAAQSSALSTLQQKRIAVIADNLADRFAAGGSDSTISNTTIDAALALRELADLSNGKLTASELIDGAAMLEKLQTDATITQASRCGTLAKYLLGLAAAGVEQSSYQSYVDAFTAQAGPALEKPAAGSYDARAYSAVWILPALLVYCPDQSSLIEQAVNAIADAQTQDGLVMGDYQTTAQALWAVSQVGSAAVSESCAAQISACTAAAATALESGQLASGAWPYSAKTPSTANLDASAWALHALASVGYSSELASTCTKAASYLQSAADDDLAHFNLATISNEPMSAAAVFLALTSAAKAQVIALDSGTLGGATGTLLTPSKVTSVVATSKKRCKIKVSWSNVSGKSCAITGYQVRIMSGSKAIKNMHFKVTKSTVSKTINGTVKKYLKLAVPKKGTVNVGSKYSGKKLSVKVRAYRAKSSHNAAAWGPASKTVKVKVK